MVITSTSWRAGSLPAPATSDPGASCRSIGIQSFPILSACSGALISMLL